MKKITYLTVLLFIVMQTSFSQEKHSRITINNPSQSTLNTLAEHGVDLRCGVSHGENNSISIDISDHDRKILQQNGISYTTEISDMQKFYNERAVANLPAAMMDAKMEDAKTISKRKNTITEKGSVSNALIDNYLQYQELNEKEWAKPLNFELGTMGGCLTVDAMEAELDQMRAYSQTNGLNIVSTKQNASTTGRKTWGNPATTISNPQYTPGNSDNGPQTYTGQGTSRWDPQTIYYIRITGNESSTSEGSKPQMLFTSMIHAREVSALMNNIYFMWYLIENYDTDPAIKNLVDNNELYFIPSVNPDGLRWNEHLNPEGGTMQRKNLRPNTGPTTNNTSLRGVDINRNFDYFWGNAGSGSSGDPANQSYRGPSPESEPETKIIKEFVQSRNFKTAVWNHTFANSIPHPYGGNPSFVSGREDEMHEMHSDMTKYNRYVSGATIFSPSNGIADDWMLGGAADGNGSIGSGKNVLATTPEHGSEGFWPHPNSIIPIAKRSVRISLMGAYYGGKYAKFHDLTQSNITSTTANLDFGIERIGQTESDFTVNVTKISENIVEITSPDPQSGMSILEQREVTAVMTLDGNIQPNEKIEYKVTLANDEGIFYEINVIKYYQPTVLLNSDPQNGFGDWTSAGWTRPSAGGYTGSRVFRSGDAVPYAENETKTMITVNGFDLSNSDEVLIQFYAKWDIERNFDLVELQASTNGTTWTTLNGKYTKPKSSSNTNDHFLKGGADEAFQGDNSSGHIYDGDQMDNWVMEEISINASDNNAVFGASNVKFRFRMRTDSENEFENYSANAEGFFIDDFKIISLGVPCDETSAPNNLAVNNILDFSAEISWRTIPSVNYDIRYRQVGETDWVEVTDHSTSTYALINLKSETDYEAQVRSRCGSSTSDYSTLLNFRTAEIVYCKSTATDTRYFAIKRVQLNTLDNSSNNGIYTDFTSISSTVSRNTAYNISISPRYENAGTGNAVGYRVWIDYNRDGDFTDAGEQVFSQDPITGGNPVSGNIIIPSNISNGNARMRVSMKFNDTPDPCETFQYGEVEDYTINLFNGLVYSNNAWTPSVPTSASTAEDIMILDGVYNSSTDINVNSVTVASGAEMTINKANSITVNGNITNNGEFILNSDSNEFSSLLLNGTVTGSLKYKRHVNANTNRNDLIAPPVSGEVFTDFISNNPNILANGAETQYLFGPFDKSTSDYVTYSNTETSTLDAGKGYRAASTDNNTFTFNGNVTTTAVNVPIVNTGTAFVQWNLIGNPYTSYIKLEDFINANINEFDSESVAVYGYDADNTDNGSYWTIRNLAYAAANPNSLIAPGQGFFVSSKAGGGTMAFTPSMRSNGSSDDFVSGRTSNTTEHFTIEMSSSSKTFGTDLYVTNNATLGLDLGYDAEHFDGSTPSNFAIYSELVENNDGAAMAIQAIGSNDVDENLIVPLGVNALQGEQITIGLSNDYDFGGNIYLEDTVANTFTLLNTSDYTMTPSSDLSNTGRFYLRFAQSVLSVDDSNLENVQVYADSHEQIVVKGQLNNATELVLYDIQGRQILKSDLNINNLVNTVSTAGFMEGVYLVQLSNGLNKITKKIIIR